MNVLLLRGFNNYFNRIVKKYSTLEDYKENSGSFLEFTDINFNPNDGITTELVIGNNVQLEQSEPLAWEFLGTPDYLVCYETDEGDSSDDSDDTDIIKYRWFVLESKRTRNGQYQLTLKRDVVAEHYESIINAPCYVEKGIIRDPNDPLLMNTEGSVFNQIKKTEMPLVDETGCAWLVGYIKKNDAGQSVSGIMSKDLNNVYNYDSLNFKDCINFSDSSTQPTKVLINDLRSNCLNIFYTICGEQWPVDHYYDYRGSMVWGQWFRIEYQGSQGNPGYGSLTTHLIYANNNDSGPTTNWASWMEAATGGGVIPAATTAAFINYLKSATKTANNLYEANDLSSGETIAGLRSQYNGAVIIKDGKYYELNFSNGGSTWVNNTYNAGSNSSIGSYMSYVVSTLNSNANGKTSFSFNSATSGNSLQSSLNYVPIIITATEIGDIEDSITINIPSAENRITCEDAQYDIFAIPYIPRQYRDKYKGYFRYDGEGCYVDSDACLFIAQKLMTTLGIQNAGGEGARAYDLQLLPYCPIKFPPADNGIVLGLLDPESYTVITKRVSTAGGAEVDMPIGYVLFPSSANFTTDIAVTKQIVHEEIASKNETFSSVSAVLDTDNTTYKIETSNPLRPSPVLSIPKGFKNITDYKIYINDQLESGAVLTVGDIIFYGWGIADDGYAFKVSNITSISSAQSVKLEIEFKAYLEGEAGAIDVKVSNECDFIRLTAPNFNSSYEFKLSKMTDSQIHYINVDCTYRPINPYIKLNPDFSGLYGQDFDDSTGLLFNGDFSLATLSNAWINYEHNNKNYQSIFNRQIQSLDTTQQLERDQMAFQNLVGAITGPVSGAAGGALTGAKLGGGYGAIAGAATGFVGGAALGIAGGIKNNEWLARQQGEAKSYTIDMYNYHLGNIKALPQSLTKGDPITYNNKVWPILEEFSCTDTEKQILREKIKYNSMTIMAIGTLENYSKSDDFDNVYVKGQLVRLTDIEDDFHIIDDIYQEVNKGFYIPQGD